MNDRGRVSGRPDRGMTHGRSVCSTGGNRVRRRRRGARGAGLAALCLLASAGRGADAPAASAVPGTTNPPALVKADLQQAGFAFVRELDPPAADRFFLLFRPPGRAE